MNVYLRFVYQPDLRGNQAPPDYIGPFPETGIASAFKSQWGPILAEVVVEQTPPPAEHVLSPGTFLDEQLRRY